MGTVMPGIFTLTKVIAAGKINRVPIVTAESKVGSRRSPVHYATELLADLYP
jgi:hypothetical protein